MGSGLDDHTPEAVAERVGHRFSNPDLLALALRHRSWCAENPGYESNERLEFLGDAVLSLAVTEHLYRSFPEMPEGELAKIRASVVSARSLAEVARRLELGAALRLGKGEETSGGRTKSSLLADATEAVLGAIYLDAGLEPAARTVVDLLGETIERAARGPGESDHKTRLQELVAREFDGAPRYEVRDEGPDHDKTFFATVMIDGVKRGQGSGRSKKEAEQEAAREAWSALADDGYLDPGSGSSDA